MKDFTNNGKCSSCGECCSDTLPLTVEEINKIKEYIRQHKIPELNKETGNFKCPFRNDIMKRCNIYSVRPYICQIYKCDTPVEKAIIDKVEISKTRTPCSMAQTFFNNNKLAKWIQYLKEIY